MIYAFSKWNNEFILCAEDEKELEQKLNESAINYPDEYARYMRFGFFTVRAESLPLAKKKINGEDHAKK